MTDISDQDVQRYLDGKVELKDLIGFDADYMKDLRGRTQFFVEGGHVERALMMLDMLEELDRLDPTPSLIAMELLLKEGRSDGAEEKLRLLRERFPKNPEVDVAEAELRIAIGELVPAAALLKRVLDADPKGATDAAKRARAVAARASKAFESS